MASLNERQGLLDKHLAAHLLRRTTYNVTASRINYFAGLSASQAVDELFDPTSSTLTYPVGPLNDTEGQIFSASDADFEPGYSINGGARIRAVDLWRIYESKEATNASWKIVNWITSIFTIRENGNKYIYHYWKMLYNMAFSNLLDLAFYITVDNYMLFYLNNNANSAASPNENYSREFLELFTIGKGDAVALGDYTNYTESDISTAARVFTGIRNATQLVSPDTGVIRGYININVHDTGPKTFSHRFQNQTINGGTTAVSAELEIKQFIQMVFDQDATAQRYARKMYRYFVNDKISPEVETDIIEPLGAQLKASGYDHIDAMKTLFKSVHFYDEDDSIQGDENIGAKIKSPYELFFTTSNLVEAVNISANNNQLFSSNFVSMAEYHLNRVGLDSRGPTTVEGFSAFNDGPGYSRNWYTPNFLYNRHTYGLSFRRGKIRNTNSDFYFKTNLLDWVNNNIDTANSPGPAPTAPEGAADAINLVNEMLQYFLVKVPTGSRLLYFRDQLLNGLSLFNWYFTWADYLDTGNENDVLIGITSLYDAILSSPEFQIF